MKKILFVLPSLKIGGLEKVQITIANALAERNYDITIIALNPECDLLDQLDGRVNYIYKPYRPHPIMRRIPYIRNKFYDDGMWEIRASAKKLYKYYVGKEKYDVEIAFFRGLPIKIISGSTNENSIKLAWVHSDFKKCGGITNNFRNIKETKKAYSKFDKIVCVSKQAKESFDTVIGIVEKSLVINNLMPIENILSAAKEHLILNKKNIAVLSCGHLIELKGYSRLLRVIKKLNSENYCFDFFLIGFGEEEKKLKDYVDSNSITNVHFLGKQDNPYKYMKKSDIYVCSSYYEGFPLTVAEAVINEMAVISTDCSGSKEILDNGKYGIVVENSEEGLYNGIKMLLDNPEKIQYYKEKARERLDFFNEEKIINKITGLFE